MGTSAGYRHQIEASWCDNADLQLWSGELWARCSTQAEGKTCGKSLLLGTLKSKKLDAEAIVANWCCVRLACNGNAEINLNGVWWCLLFWKEDERVCR